MKFHSVQITVPLDIISTTELGHETLIICRFVVSQNPGSDGWNYRIQYQRETKAIFGFWREHFFRAIFGQ